MRITPKDWTEFQHYKDRSPSWIKLHKILLDNYEFQCLPVGSRALAPMLWLLASEYENGVIIADVQKICFRLRMSETEFVDALKPLANAGFFVVQAASRPLAGRKRDSMPEKKKEEIQVREEIETSSLRSEVCAEPEEALAPATLMPTNVGGQEFPVSQAKAAEYAVTYPGVDVPQQLRSMRQWLIDNPERRKTAGGMPKFINGWLGKEQNRGPAQARAGPSYQRETVKILSVLDEQPDVRSSRPN